MVDAARQPLQSVRVEVMATELSATTDDAGRYTVNYPLGAVDLRFTRAGYTTEHLKLTIHEKSAVAADTITMYPYLRGKLCALHDRTSEPVELKVARLQSHYDELPAPRALRQFNIGTYTEILPEQPPLVLPAGSLIFLDDARRRLRPLVLHRALENGLLAEYDILERGSSWGYSERISGDGLTLGDEQVPAIRCELEPGAYAFVEMEEIPLPTGTLTVPHSFGVCYPFRVEVQPRVAAAQ